VSLSSCLALKRFDVEYFGHTSVHSFLLKAPYIETNVAHRAHAALSPWEGKNALDAAVLGYNNISALRQQLRPTHRVHGIFEGKDWAPNSTPLTMEQTSKPINFDSLVIPDYAKFMWVQLY